MEEEVEVKGSSTPLTTGVEENGVQALRPNLVELAVKFLNNPKVWERPMEDKKAFLKKKGLNEQEIETALSRASKSPPAVTVGGPPAITASNAPPLPPRALTPAHPVQPRTWSEYALMAAVAGGVAYGLVHFFKNYVIPWLNAPRAYELKLDDVHASVGQLQSTVSETLSSVAESTRSIQLLLSEQQQHIQLLTTQVTGLQNTMAQHASDQPLRQLKEEMSSLKGILLSRHQFPATPTRVGVANGGGIPVWQRASASSDSGTPNKKPEPNLNGDMAKTIEGEDETVLQNGNGTAVQDENETLHREQGLLIETSAS